MRSLQCCHLPVGPGRRPGWICDSSGAKTFCSAYGSGATTSIPCITTGQGTVQELDGNQASFLGPSFWSPNVSTAGLANCGGLILNGGPVTGSCADAQEPYVIKPGSYTHIVVNHGTYEFDQGLFDITGVAPVNSLTAAGYTADGIDHSQERATTSTSAQPAYRIPAKASPPGFGSGTAGAASARTCLRWQQVAQPEPERVPAVVAVTRPSSRAAARSSGSKVRQVASYPLIK